MSLPSPLFMSALGGSLLVAAGLITFFMPTLIRVALTIGAVGGVLLLCAGVALGYEKLGGDKRQPEVDALTKRAVTAEGLLDAQRNYAAMLEQKAANAKTDSEAAGELYQEEQTKNDKLLQERRTLLAANVANQRIDSSAVGLLDGPATFLDAFGKVSPGSPGVAAPGPGPASGDSTLGAIIDWGITCRTRYEAARNQISGWISYFDSLFPGVTP